jgi:hypothetical protein
MDEGLQDLFVERTLWGLDQDKETELSVAVGDVDGTAYEFERTVGALCVGMLPGESEMMPDMVRDRLRALAGTDAVRSIADAGVNPLGRDSLGSTERDSIPFTAGAAAAEPATTPTGVGPMQWLGWLAAAACLTYAIFVTTPESGPVPGGVVPALMARVEGAGDIIRANWAGISAIGAENHPLDSGVTGEVVWSDELDEGFMTIEGIEPNDPSEFQYQLWIFDASPIAVIPSSSSPARSPS